MPQPINLTQLRAEIEHYGPWDTDPIVTRTALHALIDTAEAAQALNQHLAMIGGGRKVESAYYRLRETLTRYKP